MCGIFGALGRGFTEGEADAALAVLAHRGPDGSGSVFDAERGLYLGHRRLSIIDLSDGGRQPMANEDGSLLLTFNGEIYNFRELRAGLLERGHRFRGHCDAEVVLHL
jgi:asparagine synthase (glutamine-hydrolysing)